MGCACQKKTIVLEQKLENNTCPGIEFGKTDCSRENNPSCFTDHTSPGIRKQKKQSCLRMFN